MSEVDEQSRESQWAKQACEGSGTRNENPRVRSILEAFRNLSIKANNLVDLKHEQVFAMSTGANILFSFDGKFMWHSIDNLQPLPLLGIRHFAFSFGQIPIPRGKIGV